MTKIEQGYEAQGYRLPVGWTWERVADVRNEYGIDPIRVPVALGPGCCAWGTPMIDGKFLTHESAA